ncbi:DUF5615 family PIN-like protein [Spirosoma rhododendri]|uniref:DUF5615 domain-containing protein n=1 Tax=Spirosoma rhododendri TaxID=2728024 RepID=A0A7L5DRZ5_9BACT|nr:DUF5615 family PIN-like protein [Spirosoma rhododendri]QJD80905.1 hypothetical protein HH216_22635 [Spirosoma rhododendri]
MKILLDENVPKKLRFRLKSRLGVTEVQTVRDMGWTGRKNGELLGLLTLNGFNLLITIDKSLYKQQNLDNFSVTVVVLNVKTTRYEDIQPIFNQLFDTILSPPPGKVVILTPQ